MSWAVPENILLLYTEKVLQELRTVSNCLKKDFYTKGGIWAEPWKVDRISGGGTSEKRWTVRGTIWEAQSARETRGSGLGPTPFNKYWRPTTRHTQKTEQWTKHTKAPVLLRLTFPWDDPKYIHEERNKHTTFQAGKCWEEK